MEFLNPWNNQQVSLLPQIQVGGSNTPVPFPQIDKGQLTQFQDLIGDKSLGGLLYFNHLQKMQEQDQGYQERILKTIDDYQTRQAAKQQKLGMESAAFASLLNVIPNTMAGIRRTQDQALLGEQQNAASIAAMGLPNRDYYGGIQNRYARG